jgi:hypothetical protein
MIHDVVRSKSFELYNDDEQLIGLMTSINGTPLFQLHNQQGIPRLLCTVNTEGNPQINLLTPGGMTLAALHATDTSARLVLCNEYGARLLEIETENDTTTIEIRNANDELVREL